MAGPRLAISVDMAWPRGGGARDSWLGAILSIQFDIESNPASV